MFAYQLELSGAAAGEATFVDTSGLSGGLDETIHAALAFDGSSLPTGVYPASLRVTSVFPFTRVSARSTNQLIHVNDIDSPFGAGWTLEGLDRLHIQPDQSVLSRQGIGVAYHYLPAEAQTYSSLVESAGPLAYFRLGETQQNGSICEPAFDEVSGEFVNYVASSTPDWFCGVPGAIAENDDTAVYVAGKGFDVNQRHLNVGALSAGESLRLGDSEEFTLEIWVRFTEYELPVALLSAWQDHLEQESQYMLYVTTSGAPACKIRRSGAGSTDEVVGAIQSHRRACAL
jgi:hypothetical protein